MGQQGIYFSVNGHRLLGTLMTPDQAGPRPTAVLLHGIPGIEKNYDLAHFLRVRGWVSLIFHYRGCWGSQGTYSLETIPEDVLAAVRHLESGRYQSVDRSRMVLIGHSLGGWAAVLAGAVDERVRGVAVYGVVSDPAALSLTPSYIRAEITPWLTGISAYELSRQWSSLRKEFMPLEQMGRLAGRPILILHGAMDGEVPVEQAHALFERASEPRDIFIHPAADHNFEGHREWLQDHLLAWLDRQI